MNSFEEQATPAPAAVRRPLPSLRLAAALLLVVAMAAVVLAWGEGWAVPPERYSGVPVFRYVNSGWISPHEAQDAGAFSEQLKAFVIVSEEELEAFEDGFVSKLNRGNTTTLGRIDFDQAALIAAYYVWRPVRGDPLTVADVEVDDSRAVVELELFFDPQGREYPYMYAPMVMVAVEHWLFPEGEPVEFVFELNGEPAVTLTATPNPG